MATQYKKDVAFSAFRNAWYRADTKDYRNLIDILMLVLGLRPGIIIQTDAVDKMIFFIEEKLVHFPTGLRLLTKKGTDGMLYVSTASSVILKDFNESMDDLTLGIFLGYAVPLTMDELYASAKQPFRLRFGMGVMLHDEEGKKTWYEPWCEVIPMWQSDSGLKAISKQLKHIVPNLRLFASILDAITRSGRYVSHVEAHIDVRIPTQKPQTWMEFTATPGPHGSCMSVCRQTTIDHMLPCVESTHDGFCVRAV